MVCGVVDAAETSGDVAGAVVSEFVKIGGGTGGELSPGGSVRTGENGAAGAGGDEAGAIVEHGAEVGDRAGGAAGPRSAVRGSGDGAVGSEDKKL